MKKADGSYNVYQIPIDSIWVNDEFNCRAFVTDEDAERLAKKIDKAGRLDMPVKVQPAKEVEGIPKGFKFRLVYGFRRVKACSFLKWETIPAFIARGLTEREAKLQNLGENINRKNLSLYEEALWIDEVFPIYRTPSSIAKELNRSEGWVKLRRSFMTMPENMRLAAASGRLSNSDVKALLRSTDPYKLFKQLIRAKKTEKIKLRGNSVPSRTEVQKIITTLLDEGFNPNFLRLLGWAIGEVDDEGLAKSLKWVRDRRGWLQ